MEGLSLADAFSSRYESVVRPLVGRTQRTVLCTIYEVRLEPPPLAELARVLLGVFNDRILQAAMKFGVEVLELRSICTDPDDFVLQIEPSAQGAEKVALGIRDLVASREKLSRASVYGRS